MCSHKALLKQVQGIGKVSSSKSLLVDRGTCLFCRCSAASVSVVTVFSGSAGFFCLSLRAMVLLLFKTKGREKEKETVAAVILDAIDRGQKLVRILETERAPPSTTCQQKFCGPDISRQTTSHDNNTSQKYSMLRDLETPVPGETNSRLP